MVAELVKSKPELASSIFYFKSSAFHEDRKKMNNQLKQKMLIVIGLKLIFFT